MRAVQSAGFVYRESGVQARQAGARLIVIESQPTGLPADMWLAGRAAELTPALVNAAFGRC